MRPFQLERYFAKYEFNVRHMLSASDCQPLSMSELLAMADDKSQELWENLRLHYSESQGHPLLRQAISEMYETIRPEDVLVCVPEEGIFLAMHTVLRKSEQFFHTSPAYQSLYEIAGSSGCKPIPLQLTPAGAGWVLDIDELRRNISRRTTLLVINFPHNPTGFLPQRSQFDALIEMARAHDMWIFSDEMYRGLEHDPAKRLPAVCDVYEKGISLCGLSKGYALPGLRIGWLVTRHAGLQKNLLMYKDYTTICSSSPSEILAIMALRNREQILQRNQAIVAKNLALAQEFFTARPAQFRWLAPGGSSVAFPEWLGESSVDDLAQKAVSDASLMLLPGSVFEHSGNHFRVGLGRTGFAEALAVFAGLVG